MAQETFGINLWVNEERYDKLQRAGLANLAKDVLAGLKVVQVPATSAQKDALLRMFPIAKCDTATTRTIELLPRTVKDRLFDLVAQGQSLDVVDALLKSLPEAK